MELREGYDKMQAAWKQRMEIWNRVYYCLRDDVVFDPDSGKWSSPDDLAALLDKCGLHEP